MFRYENIPRDVATPDGNSTTSILSPSVSATENWLKLVETERIIERMRKRKRYFIMGSAITTLLIVFGVLFYTLHSNIKALEDVYPELTEKMTVIFPDQEQPDFVPVTFTSAPPIVPSSVSTTPSPKTDDGKNSSADSAIVVVSTTTTPNPAVATTSSIAPPPRPHKKGKELPPDAAERNAIELLNSMAVNAKYTFYTCPNTQVFGCTVTLIDNAGITFGPIYGVGKKEPKRRVAELAAHYLYEIVYPDKSEKGFGLDTKNC